MQGPVLIRAAASCQDIHRLAALAIVFAHAAIPPTWTVEKLEAGFKIVDANGQSLAYVYGYAHPRDAAIAKA